MIDEDTIEIKADELKEGDLVDLESIAALKDHPTAAFELAEVLSVEPGDLLAVSFEGVERVGWLSPTESVRIAPRK